MEYFILFFFFHFFSSNSLQVKIFMAKSLNDYNWVWRQPISSEPSEDAGAGRLVFFD